MANMERLWPVALLAALALLTVVVAVPLTNAQDVSPDLDDDNCLGCHDEKAATLVNTPHRLSSALTDPKANIACVSCHSGAEVHVDDPTVDNIGNPARQSEQAVNSVCESCHSAHLEMDNFGFDPHQNLGISCADCHSVHGEHPGLLVDDQMDFCGQCHTALASEFSRTSTHPVNEGQVTCLSCHTFTGDKQPNFGAGTAENCTSCHTLVAGPYAWQHDAASSHYPGGEGCIACHSPHGSPNDRLLTKTGDGLCMQCHGVPPLHQTQHAGIGTQFTCMECHVDVHGSDYNQGLLDPDLGSKIGGQPETCFCHGTN